MNINRCVANRACDVLQKASEKSYEISINCNESAWFREIWHSIGNRVELECYWVALESRNEVQKCHFQLNTERYNSENVRRSMVNQTDFFAVDASYICWMLGKFMCRLFHFLDIHLAWIAPGHGERRAQKSWTFIYSFQPPPEKAPERGFVWEIHQHGRSNWKSGSIVLFEHA